MTPPTPFSKSYTHNSLVFTSGQIHLNENLELVEGATADITHQIMKNLKKILNEAGTDFDKVIKTTIYTTDLSLYNEFNEIYASYFTNGKFPAREMVQVAALPLGAKIEISMIAYKD